MAKDLKMRILKFILYQISNGEDTQITDNSGTGC